VHRLEHRREVPLGVEVGRRGDADGSGDRGREVAEDAPKRLEATTTSKRAGSRTNLAASASMCSWSQATCGNEAARSVTSWSQNGMVCTMPFDLVAEVRRPPRWEASVKA
jgi:hypothetical protein